MQAAEKQIRKSLQIILEQEQAKAFATANNWDWAVWTLEWAIILGDICFDILALTFTGPAGVVVADGVKELIIEGFRDFIANPSFSPTRIIEITAAALGRSLTKNADGFTEFPKPPEYKKILIWLSVFTVYRIFWHWMFTRDPHTNKPMGFNHAVKMALRDVTVRAAMEVGLRQFLQDYQAGQVKLGAESGGTDWGTKAMSGIQTADGVISQAADALYQLLSYLGSGLRDVMMAGLEHGDIWG